MTSKFPKFIKGQCLKNVQSADISGDAKGLLTGGSQIGPTCAVLWLL